eukprot:4590424-Pyramimonas_sp.AAC.1
MCSTAVSTAVWLNVLVSLGPAAALAARLLQTRCIANLRRRFVGQLACIRAASDAQTAPVRLQQHANGE